MDPEEGPETTTVRVEEDIGGRVDNKREGGEERCVGPREGMGRG